MAVNGVMGDAAARAKDKIDALLSTMLEMHQGFVTGVEPWVEGLVKKVRPEPEDECLMDLTRSS